MAFFIVTAVKTSNLIYWINSLKYHMNILIGDFDARVDRDDIFKLTTANESLHEISNDNGVRVVNFATSKNLTVKSKMFPCHNIHKYTWRFPDGKTHISLTIFQ
jgi:hypothetical protein